MQRPLSHGEADECSGLSHGDADECSGLSHGDADECSGISHMERLRNAAASLTWRS
jgi:hypothetical protein